jgi:radical SAM superfamily enzyme YgiQ (UPF0313 family)
MNEKKLSVVLGYVNHAIAGRHAPFMPLGIGLIASSIRNRFEDGVAIRLFNESDALFGFISGNPPDIIGLTNYCWNGELNRLIFKKAKEINPAVVCIAGGPEFPKDPKECKEYLAARPEIDFYCYGEGEIAVVKLIEKIISGIPTDVLKRNPHENMMSINPLDGDLVVGNLERVTDLDAVPSPYLTGLMDQWFNGDYSPSLQMTRGCPFRCAYCWTGNSQKEIETYELDRIKKELEYIAPRMQKYPYAFLSICDSNFGMYQHDEIIAEYFKENRQKYGWPDAYEVSTGKTNFDRIMRISDTLDNRMIISCSLQSTNPKTLKAIKRTNISPGEFIRVMQEMKKRRTWAITDMIMPLPYETKQSFIDGIKFVIDHDIDMAPFTLMLLKGTELASAKAREEYGILSKFRLIPREFGEYEGEKCFEVEEVCIGTNTMSFDEYVELRGLCFMTSVYTHKQFDIVTRLAKESGISIFDFIFSLWERVKKGNTGLSDLYSQYIEEVKFELWDSPEELRAYYSKDENYQSLLTGYRGDNLIRKYRARAFLERFCESVDLAFDMIGKSSDLTEPLVEAKKWMIAMRNVKEILTLKHQPDSVGRLCLSYDVHQWYQSGGDANPLTKCRGHTNYLLCYNTKKLDAIHAQTQTYYGTDENFWIGKALLIYPIQDIWRICYYDR